MPAQSDEVMHGLARSLLARLPEMTLDRIGGLAAENAKSNAKFFHRGKSIRALRGLNLGRGESAVVIAAGPSLHRKSYAEKILKSGYQGAIITTDSGLAYCLRNGIIPDLVVTIDPHARRIVRWFGDPHLHEEHLRQDDYFSRQDMDPAFADEIVYNRELLALVDLYGPKIRIALSTVSSREVVERVFDAGMQVYWWNPMLDDMEANPGGSTAELYAMNGFPCVNACGNVGAACWMMAGEVLGKRDVALVGMDMSYYDGTPYRSTQYYDVAVKEFGEDRLDEFFIRTWNPYIDQWFFSDPAYYWYRGILLEMAAQVDFKTHNCTEGGVLFGDSINFIPFEGYLDVWTKDSKPDNKINASES